MLMVKEGNKVGFGVELGFLLRFRRWEEGFRRQYISPLKGLLERGGVYITPT